MRMLQCSGLATGCQDVSRDSRAGLVVTGGSCCRRVVVRLDKRAACVYPSGTGCPWCP